MLHAFQNWNEELAPARRNSRVVDRVTKLKIEKDVLDSPLLSTEEKFSGYKYLVYRFPCNTKPSAQEEEDLRLLLRQELTKKERDRAIKTLRTVHLREALNHSEDVAIDALLTLPIPTAER